MDDEFADTVTVKEGITCTFVDTGAPGTDPLQPAHKRVLRVEATARFQVPPHWHARHTEYVNVVEGRLRVTVDGVMSEIGANDGPARVPPRAVHALDSVPGEVCVVEEWVDPGDKEYELVFRNLFSAPRLEDHSVLTLMNIFWYSESFPGMPGHIVPLEKGLTFLLGRCLAPVLGYERKYKTLKKEQ
ncbi:hypothetical protein BD626DRAFT_415509 [Schizophyllum amplum]|uniref:Cupin type-2 domain-containing protein n=1 Tax=Schizophyllum amplum TaxID=97359 RepID=A0A550BTB5_9AGAR|nr:hypothetical protein BD626DRAFT_415509 [Auriculariopsis ampla]